MAVKAYVLIEAEVGKAGDVAQGIQKVRGVKSADTVTGGYDVLATIEAADLDALGTIVKQLHSVSGICKTTTLIVVKY
jgi:DNA-binding Lrp family transcriptional regulator